MSAQMDSELQRIQKLAGLKEASIVPGATPDVPGVRLDRATHDAIGHAIELLRLVYDANLLAQFKNRKDEQTRATIEQLSRVYKNAVVG